MTVKRAIVVMGGVPKETLADYINKRMEWCLKQTGSKAEERRNELELLKDTFCDENENRFPLDAVLVDAEYAEVGLHQIKGAYGEVDIAGKPQSHLTTVDVFSREPGAYGWRTLPGAKVVVVD